MAQAAQFLNHSQPQKLSNAARFPLEQVWHVYAAQNFWGLHETDDKTNTNSVLCLICFDYKVNIIMYYIWSSPSDQGENRDSERLGSLPKVVRLTSAEAWTCVPVSLTPCRFPHALSSSQSYRSHHFIKIPLWASVDEMEPSSMGGGGRRRREMFNLTLFSQGHLLDQPVGSTFRGRCSLTSMKCPYKWKWLAFFSFRGFYQ